MGLFSATYSKYKSNGSSPYSRLGHHKGNEETVSVEKRWLDSGYQIQYEDAQIWNNDFLFNRDRETIRLYSWEKDGQPMVMACKIEGRTFEIFPKSLTMSFDINSIKDPELKKKVDALGKKLLDAGGGELTKEINNEVYGLAYEVARKIPGDKTNPERPWVGEVFPNCYRPALNGPSSAAIS